MRRLLLVACLALAAALPATAAHAALPPVKHVFVIVLENKSFDESFSAGGASQWLSKTLPHAGQLLRQYYGIGHESLDNYLAMVSGQAPNPTTQADCQTFTDVYPGIPGGDGQAVGVGCAYPSWVKTVGDQLEAAGKTWKGYMEDMGTPCRHPGPGAPDDTQTARANDQYATRHNPFVYFHSLTDDPGRCNAHDVALDALAGDLASASSTPNYAFITPDLCHDGHDAKCADGGPGGYAGDDQFLGQWVPKILGSPAYADGGMLVVTFDEAESDSTAACCNEATGPNTPSPGINGPGGGRTGTVVISPWTTPGSTNDSPYNHYALLRTVEDLFGLPHLGYAGAAGLQPFGSDVFNATPQSPAATPPRAKHKRRHHRKRHHRRRHHRKRHA
jgi:phospholipase C